MRIKSNFKDYYDHVPHVHGDGGDPKVTYVRTRIKPVECYADSKTLHDHPFTVAVKNIKVLPDLNIRGDDTRTHVAWLVVAGRYVPISRSYKMSEHVNGISAFKDELAGFQVVHPDSPQYKQFMNRHAWYDEVNQYTIDPTRQYAELIELSRILAHPVFVITDARHHVCTVSGKCPVLARMGMQRHMSAEQIYQELYYFLGNVIHPSPDMMPDPDPAMTNQERILSHGFDVKQSFRHRKG